VTLLGGELINAAQALEALSARFALVGGLAVSVRTEPRFTRDADLAVAVTEDAVAEALVFGLRARGYDVLASIEHEATGRLATARLGRVGAGRSVVVDLLFASSGIECELVEAADILSVLPGVALPVATVGHLVALKLLSVSAERPNDAADLRALATVATESDWNAATAATELIARRGYARGRDLGRALADLRRLVPPPR